MIRTGKQVFELAILANLDNTIEVKSIVMDFYPSEFNFKVCDAKWLKPGMSMQDKFNNFWPVLFIDYDTNTIYSMYPGVVPALQITDILQIQKPTFWSGTPLNVDQEQKLQEAADGALVPPITWLVETIRLKIPPQNKSADRLFMFKWFCLDLYNKEDWLNNDRHAKVVFPMTQLGQGILDAIDDTMGLERETDCDSIELSRYATEAPEGFREYLVDKNLSGTFYSTTVKVSEAHYCEC